MSALKCARYWQHTGEFSLGVLYTFHGYSGKGEGKNNGSCESVRNVGPVPRGDWTITIDDSGRNPGLARPVLRLTPDKGTETYGRSGFLIHGDNSTGTASEGCIILNRAARELIAKRVKAEGGRFPLRVFGLDSP